MVFVTVVIVTVVIVIFVIIIVNTIAVVVVEIRRDDGCSCFCDFTVLMSLLTVLLIFHRVI